MNNGFSQANSTCQVHALRQENVSPRCETILVTPEKAAEWLKQNTLNRTVRKSRVKRYARDMTNGKWLFNTQGIEFATDGSLINGQHRLMAIIMSGVSIRLVVWFGVPPTTRSVIDTGGGRSLADTANLTAAQAAVTIAMMRGLGSKEVSTKSEQQEFYRRYSQAIDTAIALVVTKNRRFSQANVVAGIARATLFLSSGDIEQFCSVLKSGIATQDPRDLTVIRFRDRLLSSAGGGGGGAAAKEIYAITVAALRAFGEGRALSKIYATTVEPFPLPEAVVE